MSGGKLLIAVWHVLTRATADRLLHGHDLPGNAVGRAGRGQATRWNLYFVVREGRVNLHLTSPCPGSPMGAGKEPPR